MPDAAHIPGGLARPGTLILVVGPSGAGKDTLIDAARAHFAGDARTVFCQRHITRTDQIGENHIPVSEPEFQRIAAEGGFFLHWRAHDLYYGIGANVLHLLAEGRTAIANVSRSVIGEAREKWPRTRGIQVTARPELLQIRLAARGRETATAISDRIRRATENTLAAADWLYEVDNSGDLAAAVAQFNALIAGAQRA